MGDLTLFLPEATVLLGLFVLFVCTAFDVSYKKAWGAGVLLATASIAVTSAYLFSYGEPFFPDIYRVDAFSQLLKLGVVAGLGLSILISQDLGSVRSHARTDTLLFMFASALGMMMLVSATELLTLYVALELSAYGLYIMAALHRMRSAGSEAGAKYILFGAASSAVTLYGLSLIYGATGTTLIADMANAGASPLLVVGVILAAAGLLFKLALFPFHAWAPDTYEGSPHQVAAFIGTASKVAAVGAIIRILTLVVEDTEGVAIVLTVLCVASMTFGNLAAIVQKDVKRLLAYSTVAHAGYIAIGLLCFDNLGMSAAIFYVITYVPIALCAFLVVSALGTDGRNPKMSDLAGLYERAPMIAFALLVSMFGLAGIPPTPGFAGKWFLFSAAVNEGLFWLVLVAAINATISLYYYLRIVKEAFLTPPGDKPKVDVPAGYVLATIASVGIILVVGFVPGPLWALCVDAASTLFAVSL
jgi:NADH-quinone oxidoreductase subunit N